MPLATLREKWVPRLVETAAVISREARSSAMRSGYRG
jgi:hypothetical protein